MEPLTPVRIWAGLLLKPNSSASLHIVHVLHWYVRDKMRQYRNTNQNWHHKQQYRYCSKNYSKQETASGFFRIIVANNKVCNYSSHYIKYNRQEEPEAASSSNLHYTDNAFFTFKPWPGIMQICYISSLESNFVAILNNTTARTVRTTISYTTISVKLPNIPARTTSTRYVSGLR